MNKSSRVAGCIAKSVGRSTLFQKQRLTNLPLTLQKVPIQAPVEAVS